MKSKIQFGPACVLRSQRYDGPMRWIKTILVVVFLSLGVALSQAADAKVIKVLPHFLDLQGRHALNPSLYERDAYQAHLRKTPAEQSGIRYDIQWRARGMSGRNALLRLEIHAGKGNSLKPIVVEKSVKPRTRFSRWSSLQIDGDQYKKMGAIISWRVTLWDEGHMIGEQHSFMWQE